MYLTLGDKSHLQRETTAKQIYSIKTFLKPVQLKKLKNLSLSFFGLLYPCMSTMAQSTVVTRSLYKSLFLGQGPAQESEGEEDKEKEAALKSRRSRRQTLAMARKRSAEEDDINASQMANLLTVLDRHQIQART
jgi:hypothetical protein